MNLMDYSTHIKNARPTECTRERFVIDAQNLIKDLADCFGRNSDKFRRSWAERLVDAGFKIIHIEEAVEHCADSVTSLPSFAEFKSIVRLKSQANQVGATHDSEFTTRLAKERKLAAQMRSEWVDMGGEEKLAIYVKKWFAMAFGEDLLKELDAWGLELKLFEHCALIDWHEARYKIDNLQKVIDKKRNVLGD